MDILREMGGVTFVFNLSKTGIVHPDVKITALFTLGTLAEANGKLIKLLVWRLSYLTKLICLFFRCVSVL